MSWALISSEVRRTLSRRLVRWSGAGMMLIAVIVWIINLVDPPQAFGQVRIVEGIPIPIQAELLLDTDRARSMLLAFSPTLLGLALLVSSSVVGAEWASRGLTNLLIWEPRRIRLLGSKLLAISIVAGSAIVIYLLVVLAGIAAVTLMAGGRVANLDMGTTMLVLSRVAALAVMIAMLGATTAAVMRSTIASAVVAFLLLAIVQPILTGVSPDLGRWLFTTNGVTFLLWTENGIRVGQEEPWAAGLVLAAYAAAFIGVSMAVFRRQEIG